MNFPVEVEYKAISESSPHYFANKLKRYDALYHGGTLFHKHIDEFLDKRQIENAGGAWGKQYDERKKKARYANRVGGLCDWFAAAVFDVEPRIETQEDILSVLNDDCDGIGTDLPIIARDALLSGLKFSRAYLAVLFDAETGRFNVSAPSAMIVDDWEHDKRGKLLWARTCIKERIRGDIGQPVEVRKVWTYYTDTQIATYEIACKDGQEPKDKDKAKLVSLVTHDLGINPIIEVKFRPGQWVIERVADTAVALFNREANLGWLIDMCAFPQAVLNSDKDIKEILTSETLTMKLSQGESYSFAQPAGATFQPSFDDIKRLEGNLFTGIQSMAIEAASIPQAGRLSGKAISEMRDPLHVLLSSFAWPIREAFETACNAILEFKRKPKDSFELIGFSRFTATMDDAKQIVMGEDKQADGPAKIDDDGNGAVNYGSEE